MTDPDQRARNCKYFKVGVVFFIFQITGITGRGSPALRTIFGYVLLILLLILLRANENKDLKNVFLNIIGWVRILLYLALM